MKREISFWVRMGVLNHAVIKGQDTFQNVSVYQPRASDGSQIESSHAHEDDDADTVYIEL